MKIESQPITASQYKYASHDRRRPTHALLDTWRMESPDDEREERNHIYEKIMEAESTGILSIEAKKDPVHDSV